MKRILWLVVVLALSLSPIAARSKIGNLPTDQAMKRMNSHY